MASSHQPSFASSGAGSSTSGSAVVSRSGFLTTEVNLVTTVTESFSSLATGDPDPSVCVEEMVLGQPQPFKGDEVFEEGERALYTKVTLPGAFKKQAKLWAQYGKMYVSALEVKAVDYRARDGEKTVKDHVFNDGGGASISKSGMFVLTFFAGEKEKPSSGEGQSVFHSKVELPGIYGEAVKLWVKSGVTFFGEEIKTGVSSQSHKVHLGKESDSLLLKLIPRLNDTGSLSLPLKRNPEQPQPSRASQLPSTFADGGSSSSGNASVVLGQPQPFNGSSAFKKGERLKYTRVELPDSFQREVKLWVKYEELYLMAIEWKPKATRSSNCKDAVKPHYYNHGPGASMYNGTFYLSLARRANASPTRPGRHPSPSDEKDTLYSKVELPGIYGEGAKMWVKSDSIIVNSMDIKAEDICSKQELVPRLQIDKDGAKIGDLTVTLVFAPKVRE